MSASKATSSDTAKSTGTVVPSGADINPSAGTNGQNGPDPATLTAASWAGIGVVVAVISIALLGLAWFLVRMRRKKGEDDLLDGRWGVGHREALARR